MEQTQTNTVFFKMPVEVLVEFNDGTDTIVTGMNDANPQILEWTFGKYPENVTFDPGRMILLKQGSTIVGMKERDETGFQLKQNEPNPFRNTTSISYSLGRETTVKITILDNQGKTILTPVNGAHQPGEYQFILNGEQLSSGIYYCNMEAGNRVETIKLVCQK